MSTNANLRTHLFRGPSFSFSSPDWSSAPTPASSSESASQEVDLVGGVAFSRPGGSRRPGQSESLLTKVRGAIRLWERLAVLSVVLILDYASHLLLICSKMVIDWPTIAASGS